MKWSTHTNKPQYKKPADKIHSPLKRLLDLQGDFFFCRFCKVKFLVEADRNAHEDTCPFRHVGEK